MILQLGVFHALLYVENRMLSCCCVCTCVQVVGSKRIRIYSPVYSDMLYPHDSIMLNNTSQVDCERPDLARFPKFVEAQYWECVVKPGDLLYIPPKFWHYVRSLAVSFSVSFWWK